MLQKLTSPNPLLHKAGPKAATKSITPSGMSRRMKDILSLQNQELHSQIQFHNHKNSCAASSDLYSKSGEQKTKQQP